jgi:hypothetical protein
MINSGVMKVVSTHAKTPKMNVNQKVIQHCEKTFHSVFNRKFGYNAEEGGG